MSQNVFTLKAVADWCDKHHEKGEEYYWADCHNCACGQYGKFLGVEWLNHSQSNFWRDLNTLACIRPHTFGALAKRLRNHKPPRTSIPCDLISLI